jgi:hypothetical protein
MRKVLLFVFACLLLTFSTHGQAFSAFQGIGSVQFYSNTGVPLTSGVLYTYAAGTTTLQPTFTDSTGTVQNPNPIPFGSGARATIWLTSGLPYKFVLCAQNDGASCAAGDVLYSVDQVVAGIGSSGSSTFTGIFVSSSSSPATAGALRLANSDQICWRNSAGTANLCFSMNGNNLLNWAGGSLSMPQIASIAAQCTAGFDYIWADNTANRWMMCNNGGTAQQIVGTGGGINQSDQVISLDFSGSIFPLGAAPTSGQYLQDIGGTIVGTNGLTQTYTNAASIGTTLNEIAKLTGAPSTVVNTTTSDTGGQVGICFANCGTTGSATIALAGQVSCVFDGSSTAGDYVQISTTVAGNCHDVGANYPSPGSVIGRVLTTNSGAGTYGIDLFPAEIRSPVAVQLFTNKNLASNVPVTANTTTTIDSISVTMPSSGGPFRVLVTYAYYMNGGVNGECWVEDGTNFWALWEEQTAGNILMCSGSQWSPTTYANGAAKTFTVQTFNTGATAATTVGSLTGSVPSSMQIAVFASN